MTFLCWRAIGALLAFTLTGQTAAPIPLEAGMVVSVETTLLHQTRGFIKLEDTVVVTETGHEIYGGGLRGWNRAGTATK